MAKRLCLGAGEVAEWERAAGHMYVPFDEQLGVHPQDAGFLAREVWDLAATPAGKFPLLLNYHPLVIYRFQVLKQADVVMALFLQSDQFTPEEKLADFTYYDPLTTGDSTLSKVAQSIIAAEVGFSDVALEYFAASLFTDLADLHRNTTDGVHVAAAGGVWQTLVNGFGGMRDRGGQISIDPRLPPAWTHLTYRIAWRGTRLKVTVSRDSLTLDILSGAPVALKIRGTEAEVTTQRPLVVALDGHGPVLPGRPVSPALHSTRRKDGSVITASVPGEVPRL
jgi:alpha,alpha-trehalose phosphorylase